MSSRRIVFAAPVLMSLIATGLARGQVVNSEWNAGSGTWNVSANWLPVGVPDNGGGLTFNVQIGNRPVAANAAVNFVPQDGTSDVVSTLTVSGGADLLIGGTQLNVMGLATINGGGTSIRVEPHNARGTASFTTLNLDLNTGGGLVMSGGIATVNALLQVNANSVVGGFGTVIVGNADATATQALENSGQIQVFGTSTDAATLTLRTNGVDTIDLDGDTETGVVNASNAAANLTLDTLKLVVDGPLADPFGGVGGTLQIGQRDTVAFNQNFQIATGATIQMNGGNDVATLNGAGSITSIAGAKFNVTGDAVIANNMTFTGTANTVTLAANASLRLDGTVSIPQASALVLGTASELIIGGATTITDVANDFDWDGVTVANTKVQGSGVLTLNVNRIDVGNDTYNGTLNLNDNGSLTVNVTGTSWTMAGTLNKNLAGTSTIAGDALNVAGGLNVNAGTLVLPATALASGATVTLDGGTLAGGAITVGNTTGIKGHGLVSARVVNNTRLHADTGTLVFQTAANDNDWDGATNVGALSAANGSTLELRDNATFTFGGTVTAAANSRVLASGFGFNLSPSSSINLTQGTYESGESSSIGGAVNVAAGGPSTIKVQVNRFLTFQSTSATTLNGDLRIESNNASIQAGASFSGSGALSVPKGSHAILEAGANANVLFDNQGTLRPAGFNTVGRADVRDYQQRPAAGPNDNGGQLFVEITGTSLNQFDRLVVNGTAQVGGYLNLDIDGAFVPALGQTFNIITASGGLVGKFDMRDTSGMPAGLTFAINYLPNAVQLKVVNKPFFSADFDDDGDVDFTDLAIWRNAFDLNQLGDANGDNRTDIDDWTIWRDQFGSEPSFAAAAVVPEPSTGVIAVALAALGLRRRSKRRPRGVAAATVLCCAAAFLAIPSDANAAPAMSVTDNGVVGGNRQWLVQVAPDPARFVGGKGSLAVELGFEVTAGELLSATVNTAAWAFDLPTKNSPFGTGADGLNVDTAADTVFAALGSNPFTNGSFVPVLTIVTEGAGPTTLTWGGYTVPSLGVPGARIAQAGTSFNGYQGSLTLGGAPAVVWDNTSGSGLWSDAVNWAGDAEPAAASPVIFPAGFPNGDTVVALSAGEAAQGLIFNDSYTLLGGSLTLPAAATISVAAGKTATITSVLNVGARTKTGDGTLGLTNVRADALTVGAGTLRVLPGGGDAGTSRVTALAIVAGAKLDLTDHKLILAGGDVAAVTALVKLGYNGGTFDGPGVMTSAANSSRGLGVARADQVGLAGGTFGGIPVLGGDVLVRFTLYGDADLNGAVNFSDLVRLAQNYNTSGKTWPQGDFTFDNAVNFSDLVKLAQNYNTSLAAGAIPGAAAGFDADWAVAMAAVPEPGAMAVAGWPILALLFRRNRA